jgi:hypothetical protein
LQVKGCSKEKRDAVFRAKLVPGFDFTLPVVNDTSIRTLILLIGKLGIAWFLDVETASLNGELDKKHTLNLQNV